MARSTAAEVHPRGPLVALLLLLLLGLGMRGAEAQQACAGQLSDLAPCTRYSVPPAPGQPLPAPGPECCSALGSVTRDCACGALDIINSLPAKCGLPRVSCRKACLPYTRALSARHGRSV
ncbi:protein YY1-like [Phragmites australis]|uniref:protein YY1-like n=1 Tax=Phragmites australis TaxID=29695 RepID=UPI002D795D51|nr:protein YY1-like [Phragmites australis]